MENIKKYYLFGLQRSGTNYSNMLLTRNFHVKFLNNVTDMWKHSIDRPKNIDNNTVFAIFKNPYLWIESLCFRSQVDFIKTQKTYDIHDKSDPELMAGNHSRFNVVSLAKFYKHWADTWISNENYLINYHELLIDEKREAILEDIQNKFQLEKRLNSWFNPDMGKVMMSRLYNNSHREYYIQQVPKYLNNYHLNAITNILGTELLTKLNFDILGN